MNKNKSKQPLWTLKDFAEYIGVNYSTITSRMQNTLNDKRPIIVTKKNGIYGRHNDNLYYLKDLKSWFQETENNLMTSSHVTNKYTTKLSGTVKKIYIKGYAYYKALINKDSKQYAKTFGEIRHKGNAKLLAEQWLEEKQKEFYPDFK